MKYIVTFKHKKTQVVKAEVEVEYDENKVKNNTGVLCLAAIEQLKEKGEKIPNKNTTRWSWIEKN